MRRTRFQTLTLRVAALTMAALALPDGSHSEARVADASQMADAPRATGSAWWVFLTDKGLDTPEAERAAIDAAARALTPQARARRAKVRGSEITDLLDVPLHTPYVDAVLAEGVTERHRLRWLNAVTVNATSEQADRIRALPSVARVRPVATQRHRTFEPAPEDIVAGSNRAGRERGGLTYGECASQITPIQVDQLHALGYSGSGVRVCLMDTGFLRTHQAFASLNVVAEHDFVQGDGNTVNEGNDPSNQHNHGTYVLSILAGYDPGYLIGPAYGADVLLAKTETLLSETPAEEDNWAAAAQWADSLGADIISSSLSYKDWYQWEDLDGDTATITIAADLAVANGIAVITSAGNYGTQDWMFIAPPADGDSVIAVGATDSTGTVMLFSSRGPTWDGRTKPDVCAMGENTFFALVSSDTAYARGDGTSFSCPLTAGTAALLLEARPDWTPVQLREALRSTASNAATPDNDQGWGEIRGFDALGYSTSAPTLPASLPGVSLSVSPNPSADVSVIRWSLPAGVSGASLEIVDVTGRRLRKLHIDAESGAGVWNGRDESGLLVASGIYFAQMVTREGTRTARVVRIR